MPIKTNVAPINVGKNVDFFTLYETIPVDIAAHIDRFSTLHWTDWYFNRAVHNTLLGAVARFERRRSDGKRKTRGAKYRAKATLKLLTKWRRILETEKPPSMKARGLLPATPSRDQKLLFGLLHAT